MPVAATASPAAPSNRPRRGRQSAPLERVALSFPPDLNASQVAAVLGAIAGLPKRSRIECLAAGSGGQLSFELCSTERNVAIVTAALQGIAPGVRVTPAAPDRLPKPTLRAHVSWRGSYVLLRGDEPELAIAGLLSVLRSTSASEDVRLRVWLRPLVRPNAPPYSSTSRDSKRDGDWLTRFLTPAPSIPRDQLRAVRQQYGGPLLGVRLEVDVEAASRERAKQLVSGVAAVLRARSGVRGRFSVRSHPWAWPGVGFMVAPTELVALMGWPLAGPQVPSLRFNRAPRLLPDASIPSRGRGRIFGTSTWPGLEQRRLLQPEEGALSHSLILGPTGSGKSALLTHLFLSDVAAGRAAVLVDMKGDTAVDVLQRIPEKRQRDVVVLDPADHRPPPGIKAIDASSPELSADLWAGIFRNLFRDNWGLRSERYLRLGVQTLAQRSGHTITDLPRVFHDASFRTGLLRASGDRYLIDAWAELDGLSPTQRAEYLAPMLSKVHDVVSRRVVRDVLGQSQPKLRLAEAMQRRKIVVVRLRPGSMGSGAAQLVGAVVVFEAYQAILARQNVAQEKRRPVGFYVDEPAVLGSLPLPLDSIFELARGLGVGMTIAAQSLTQLPESVRRAALTNAATIAAFASGADDARLLARELVGVSADQLQHLERYEIALRLGLGHGERAPVTTARTLAPTATTSDLDSLLERSSAEYGGRSREAELLPDPGPDPTPIGRQRRTQ